MKLLIYLFLFYMAYKVFFPAKTLERGNEEKKGEIKFNKQNNQDGEYIDYEEVD